MNGIAYTAPERREGVGLHMSEWEGFVDLISQQEIAGWVRRVGHEEPVEIEIFQADRLLANITADLLRPDLAQAGKGEGRHGFSFRCVPDALEHSADNPIQVRVRGSTYLIPVRENVQSPAEIPPALPTGLIERFSRQMLSGWAWRPGSDERLEIEVVVNDVVVASAVADIFRADLLAAGVGDGKHAFQLRPPAAGFAIEFVMVRVKDGPLLEARAQDAGSAANDAAGATVSDAGAIEGFIGSAPSFSTCRRSPMPSGRVTSSPTSSGCSPTRRRSALFVASMWPSFRT